MWPDLEPEMDAFKRSRYSDSYRQFRMSLPSGTDAQKEKKREFLEIENAFLYLISYVIGRFNDDGWGQGTKYPHLLTSHMLRLLSEMTVSLKDHWNPAQNGTNGPPIRGNLHRSAGMLISKFEPPMREPDQYAMWGTDFWDDCYILLSLLKVKKQLRDIDRTQHDTFVDQYRESLGWFRQQVANKFRTVAEKSSWFGPGFHAAAIELIDYLHQNGEIKDGPKLIGDVVRNVAPIIKKAAGKGRLSWDTRFAWHAGQIIVTWAEKRNIRRYTALRSLDGDMQKLYKRLIRRQDPNDGAWRFDGDSTNTNYNTVRALAACYVMEKDKMNGLLNSRAIEGAHGYLLRQTHEPKPLGGVDKACVNAIEAFQKLFGFTIPNIHFHLLVSLSYRLHCLGLERVILSPPAENEHRLLKAVRRISKRKLENHGQQAIEPMGVNGRLYDYLNNKTKFLDEFNESDHEMVRRDLQGFLSSTMTEVRSTLALGLIRDLWSRAGLLNFLSLIDHLSSLEREQAFYAFYRDHLNHEVLLFLLGAHIYYENQTFRENIHREIVSTYEHFQANPPEDLEKEFLFRWKLIATFHDIGYLFEIDPDEKRYKSKKEKETEKKRLLGESFGMIETVRSRFLQEYFKQFPQNPAHPDIKADIAAIEKGLKKYLPAIGKAEDLFTLKTSGKSQDAFGMMDQMLNPRNPGGMTPGLIKQYFNLCRRNPSEHRDRFYDHGIMSALILLKVADIHRFYLQQLSDERFSKKLNGYPEFQKLLMEESTDKEAQERFYIRFSHVAGAIALHNIYPHLYSKSQCHAFDATRKKAEDRLLERAFYPKDSKSKDRYAISLVKNPMAYLTALADVLQDWDRHSFRKTPYEQDDKTPIASSEVIINCAPHRIIVTPLSAHARKRYVNHLRGMGDYMLKCSSYVQVAPLENPIDEQLC